MGSPARSPALPSCALAGGAGNDESALVGGHDGLRPVAHAELREYPADVGLHGLLRDEQLARDLLVAASPGDLHEHLPLAVGETVELRGAARGRTGREALDHPPGDARGE